VPVPDPLAVPLPVNDAVALKEGEAVGVSPCVTVPLLVFVTVGVPLVVRLWEGVPVAGPVPV
jgi:hypothetical protein